MTDMLEHALSYAREGWAVFPARADKTPLIDAWPERATTDPDQIRAWWEEFPTANIATVPGERELVVVDYDTKGGRDLDTLLTDLDERVGEALPDTSWVVVTPTGGEHHYYWARTPPRSSNAKVADYVDVRGTHGYVLLPPSRTKDGEYSWASPTTRDKPPALPDAALAHFTACARRADKDANRDEWIIEPDLPECVEEAVTYLRGHHPKYPCRPSISGQGGNQALYDTAAMLHSFGVSEPNAVDLLLQHYNPERCHPPWEAEDVIATTAHAYRYHTSPPGNVTRAYRLAQLQRRREGLAPITRLDPSTGKLVETEGFRIADLDALAHLPPPSWLVDPLLMVDTNAILTGGYGTFKTFLALDLALSLAADESRDSFNWEIPDEAAGPVVIMVGEGRSGIRDRIEAWKAHHDVTIASDKVLIVDPVPHITTAPERYEQLIDALKALHPEGYALTVIDTMGRAIGGANENSSEAAGALTQLTDALRRDLGTTVLTVAHTRKDASVGRGATRGSGVFENDADTVMNLDRRGDSKAVRLTVAKQKDAPEAGPYDLRAVLSLGSLVLRHATPQEVKLDDATLTPSTLDAVEEALHLVLATDKHAEWSTANVVECAEREHSDLIGGISAKTIRNNLMALSKDRTRRRVQASYRVGRGRKGATWKWTRDEGDLHVEQN